MSVLFVTVVGKWCLPILMSTNEIFTTYSLSHPAEEEQQLGGHLALMHSQTTRVA